MARHIGIEDHHVDSGGVEAPFPDRLQTRGGGDSLQALALSQVVSCLNPRHSLDDARPQAELCLQLTVRHDAAGLPEARG